MLLTWGGVLRNADAEVSIAANDAASRVFKIYGRLESFADKDLICVIDWLVSRVA